MDTERILVIFFLLLYILVKVKTCKKKSEILAFFLVGGGVVQNVVTFPTFLCGKPNQKWQSCHFLLFFSKMLQKSGPNIFYKRNIQEKYALGVKVTVPHPLSPSSNEPSTLMHTKSKNAYLKNYVP